MNHVDISYEQLFEFLELEDEYNEYLFSDEELFIETPENGLTKILSYTKKPNHNIVRVILECGRQIEVSQNHVVREYGKEVNILFAEYLDTNSGTSKIVDREVISIDEDVYDISIESPHWFYDAHGVIHHNSLFGSSLASSMLMNNQNVLIVTLEMSDFEYFKRVDANVLDININSFYHLSTDQIMSKFNAIKDKVGTMKSVEYPAGRFSALQLEALLEKLKHEGFIPDIVIVDYLALMKSDRHSSITNSNSYYTAVAEDLRAIAQIMDIPVISFTQLLRGSVNTNEFSQDSISLAKGIYEAADTFFFLISNADMKENGEIGIICDKNRNTGMTNRTIMLGIDYQKMRVTDEGTFEDDSSGFDMVESDMSNQAIDGLDFSNFNF